MQVENKVEIVVIKDNDFKSLIHIMLKDFFYVGNPDEYMEYQADDEDHWTQAFEKLNARVKINSVVLSLRNKAEKDNLRGDFSMMINLAYDVYKEEKELELKDYCDFTMDEAGWRISFTEGVNDMVMTVVESY